MHRVVELTLVVDDAGSSGCTVDVRKEEMDM